MSVLIASSLSSTLAQSATDTTLPNLAKAFWDLFARLTQINIQLKVSWTIVCNELTAFHTEDNVGNEILVLKEYQVSPKASVEREV